MLDAGYAKDINRDIHIKHIHPFEGKIISKLINSPDYLGREYLCKDKNSEKYIKNRRICKLIDEIRYNNGLQKIQYAKKHSANINHKGISQSHINGGNASTIYNSKGQLDLGDAGPLIKRATDIFVPHIDNRNKQVCNFLDSTLPQKVYSPKDTIANLHYKEFRETQINGGNASTIYNSTGKLDLGDAGLIPDRDCNVDPPHIDTDCSEKSQVPRGHSANLHYKEFRETKINGGNASTIYNSKGQLDLGNAGLIPHRDCNVGHPDIDTNCSEKSQISRGHSANLHYKEFKQTQINGGNASTIYNSTGQLDLGNAGSPTHTIPSLHMYQEKHINVNSANLHYNGFSQSRLNGGNAYTTYSLADEIDLGDSRPPIHIHGENYILSNQLCNILDENKSICVSNITPYTGHYSANLHYSNFTQSNLNGGNASTIYNSTEHLDLGNSTHLTN